jgi:hypothetical protein
MKHKTLGMSLCLIFLLVLPALLPADQRSEIFNLGVQLEEKATELAQSSFEHFKGWNETISDQEQTVLFRSEAFAATCRLFLKLTEEKSGYYSTKYLRTNLYNAFVYLYESFRELEGEMKKSGIMPYALSDCRKILGRMESAFERWPSADNLAYLDQKYVKGRDATVYLIVKRSTGVYIRHPFKNLESIFRYNYDMNRGEDPWKYLVEVSTETLDRMERADMIDLNFNGCLVIELSNRPNRPVFLIENGKKRGITSPEVLQRFGGWGKVLKVPAEVINGYPEGEPIY